jgi:hypothetical protein
MAGRNTDYDDRLEVRHWDGTSWHWSDELFFMDAQGMWGLPTGELYAVGRGGMVIRSGCP